MSHTQNEISALSVVLLELVAATGHFGGDAVVEAGVEGVAKEIEDEVLVAGGDVAQGGEVEG